MTRRPVSSSRLFGLLLLALLPLLVMAGGGETARAGVPPIAPAATPAATAQARPEAFVFRVYFSDLAERDRLVGELGAEEAPTAGGFITVIGDRDMYNSLLARGQRFDVDQDATRELNTPISWGNAPDTFYGGYHTVEEVYAFLDDRVATYPGLVEKIDIGDSWCKTHPGVCTQPNPNNGYDLYALHITNRSIPGPKPVFWYNTGLHAREIVPPELAIRYIDSLLDGYDTNADARWLVDWHDIWVMVLHNPDGHHIVEAPGEAPPYLHRKNGDRDDGCTTWPPSSSNHFGVDLNRNFPYKWNYCGGCSSGAPCAQTYRGPNENSEEETQAVVAKIRQLIPDQRGPGDDDASPITTTGMYLDMHSFGRYNLYPYGWTTTRQAPNHIELDNIAQHMRAPNAGPPGNNYTSCQAGPCFYATDGASDDWAYGDLGIGSYTTEVGTSFTPQYNCIDNPGCGTSPGLWPENRGMLLYLAKIARTPYLTTRGPDTNNPATNPMTVTQGTPSLLSATINYTWQGNNYTQNVGGAEYYIDTPPWAGGSAIPMQATDGAFDSPTEQVQATIDTSSIPPGRHVIFVRGRGVNNYAGLGSWGPVSATWLTVTGGGGTPTPTTMPTFTPRVVTPGPTQVCITIQGSISSSDPTQVGMLNQVGTASLCQWPPYRACPGLADTLPRHYKVYSYYSQVGSFSSQCVTVRLNPSGCAGNLYSAAYVTDSASFDPNNICLNYAGDAGVVASGSSEYTFFVFRGQYFHVVVHEVGPNTGCSAYTVEIISDIPCNNITSPTPSATPVGPTSTAVAPTSTAPPPPPRSPTPTAIPTCGPAWRPVQPPYPADHSSLLSLSADAPNDIWAAGYYYPEGPDPGRTLVLHWDGMAWDQVPSPNVTGTPSSLHAITALGPNDVWAVGHTGTVGGGATQSLTMHWDGQSWTIQPSPNPGPAGAKNTLVAVSAASSTDVWAVGSYSTSFGGASFPYVLQWTGNAWTHVNAPSPGDGGNGTLFGVKAFAPNDVWAVGNYGVNIGGNSYTRPLALHWDGLTWTPSSLSNQPDGTLHGIDGVSNNDLWAVGTTAAGVGGFALILRYTDGVWSRISAPPNAFLKAVSARTSNDVWAVGNWQGYVSLHWNGVAWSYVPTPSYEVYLSSVAAVSPGAAWAVSPRVYMSTPPPILHYSDPCTTPTPTPTSTGTVAVPPTATPCTLSFTDVPSEHTFYDFIRCLACRGIISGYADNTFRPGNNITRGQISKMVSNAAGFNEPVEGQTYTDVPPTDTFYEWIERLSARLVMSGYACGGVGEPCDDESRPYFRPGANATRGQLSKIVSNAAGYNEPVSGVFYADVPTTNTFYSEIMRLTNRNVMSGYPCGGAGEPCDPENRPYFRWGFNVTRGQASKIVANTFLPGCVTP